MGLDEHGSKTSYIDNPSQKNAFFRLLHPFLSASLMNDPIRQHWKTQSLKSPKSKNHLYKKLLHAMFMITVKIIFTVFWLFLLTFEGYFVQQNCNSRTAKLLTPSRQMFRFDYLTSRLNIYISGKITTFSRCSKSIKTKHAENYLIFKLIYIKL